MPPCKRGPSRPHRTAARAGRGRLARCLVLAAGLILAAPATASAGTARVADVVIDGKYQYSEPGVFYAAAPGERNQVVVTREGSSMPASYTVRDAGAPVTAGAGCVAVDAHAARCSASGAFVDAGDGDDAVAMPVLEGIRGHARGGDGDDTITGAGVLAGGPGRDTIASTCTVSCRVSVLAGGPGDDVLRGGPAEDELSGDGTGRAWPQDAPLATTDAGGGNDVIDGGGGTDMLTYDGRDAGVRVDLALGRADGPGGERDRVSGVEVVTGGDGADLLLGGDGPEKLLGGPGDDRIEGRGGDDYLLGYFVPSDTYTNDFFEKPDGADVLRGGSGDDTLDAGYERGDAIYGDAGDDLLEGNGDGLPLPRPMRCGSGSDRLAFDPRGRLLTDCERVQVGIDGLVSVRPQRRRRALRFAATCRSYPIGVGCSVGLGIRLGSSRAVSATIEIANGGRRAFLVRTSRTLRRGQVVEITVGMARGVTPTGSRLVWSARWRVKL